MKSLLTFMITLFLTLNVFALRKAGSRSLKGGTFSMGVGLGMGSYEQDGINDAIRSAKSLSGATSSLLNAATEYIGFATYRFSNNIIALQLRGAGFNQASTGTGTGGSYDYKLSGFTFFPLIRYVPLSNDFIDFYIQGGLGYGKLEGSISNGARKISFGGSSFGTQVGIGSEFCLISAHCLGVEGNYRYLPVERNKVSSASGALPDGIGQSLPDHELENTSGDDIGTKLTGISGVVTYTFNF